VRDGQPDPEPGREGPQAGGLHGHERHPAAQGRGPVPAALGRQPVGRVAPTPTMRRRVNVYHYLLAVHGLALLRRWLAPAAPAENDTEAAAAEPGTERHRLHAATPGDHESRPGADEHLGASRWLRPTAAID